MVDGATNTGRALGRFTIAVVALSVVLHLWRLGLRPLAHEESIDAWLSWHARHWGVVPYDPVYHGPLRFYLVGPVLGFLGTSAFWVRIIATLAGIATTVMLARSPRPRGRVGAPLAALLFTISPTALTVTRTGREDSLVALVNMALLLLVALLLTAPRRRHLLGVGALLAVSLGLKETTFLFGLAAVLFLAGAGIVAARRPDGEARAATRRLIGLGRDPWLWAVITTVVVFMVIYTSGFRYIEGFESGLLDGVRYWWGQHDVRRGGQPWFFHVAVWAAYEWLLLIVFGAGVAVVIARRSLVGAWFLTMALVQVVLYSWAGEKFAWLALHPLLPMFLLAGIGGQEIFDRLHRVQTRRIFVGAFAVLAALTTFVAVRPAIFHGADARELLVTVQTSSDVPPVVERLRRAHERGDVERILVDDTGGGSWPWVWYLHGLEGVQYLPIDPAALPPGFDAYLVLSFAGPPVVPEGYEAERFRARIWWVPDYDNATFGDLTRWFFTREVWSPTASLDEFLIIRSD